MANCLGLPLHPVFGSAPPFVLYGRSAAESGYDVGSPLWAQGISGQGRRTDASKFRLDDARLPPEMPTEGCPEITVTERPEPLRQGKT
jgi:hypothetical protein